MNSITRMTIFLVTFCANFYVFGQAESTQMKNGIYLSSEEFKSNSPSLPISVIINESTNKSEMGFCVKKVEYLDENEGIKKIKANEIWAMTINSNSYLRYTDPNNPGFILSSESCFFKIYHLGAISLYYVQKAQSNVWTTPSHYGTNFNQPQPTPYNNPVNFKMEEYGLIFESGKSYRFKTNASNIIDYIKQDDYFKDTKMKKKDLAAYISQYNKRHPITFTN